MQADCTAALADVQDVLPPADQAKGLAHALQVVEANCEKNLQAPGLLVALDHLVANYQRQLAHQADEAAKVHPHGNSGEHGQASGNSH